MPTVKYGVSSLWKKKKKLLSVPLRYYLLDILLCACKRFENIKQHNGLSSNPGLSLCISLPSLSLWWIVLGDEVFSTLRLRSFTVPKSHQYVGHWAFLINGAKGGIIASQKHFRCVRMKWIMARHSWKYSLEGTIDSRTCVAGIEEQVWRMGVWIKTSANWLLFKDSWWTNIDPLSVQQQLQYLRSCICFLPLLSLREKHLKSLCTSVTFCVLLGLLDVGGEKWKRLRNWERVAQSFF